MLLAVGWVQCGWCQCPQVTWQKHPQKEGGSSMGGKATGHRRTGGKATMKQTCLVCAGFGSLEMWVKTGETCPEVNIE